MNTVYDYCGAPTPHNTMHRPACCNLSPVLFHSPVYGLRIFLTTWLIHKPMQTATRTDYRGAVPDEFRAQQSPYTAPYAPHLTRGSHCRLLPVRRACLRQQQQQQQLRQQFSYTAACVHCYLAATEDALLVAHAMRCTILLHLLRGARTHARTLPDTWTQLTLARVYSISIISTIIHRRLGASWGGGGGDGDDLVARRMEPGLPLASSRPLLLIPS